MSFFSFLDSVERSMDWIEFRLDFTGLDEFLFGLSYYHRNFTVYTVIRIDK